MCGIVGYIGEKECTEIIIQGLKRLEYRGYDSAGLAVIDGSGVEVRRCEGKIVNLEEKFQSDPCKGKLGIGHTRWATHGRPSEENAHPHVAEGIAVVHNGIVENHLALKNMLIDEGAEFTSDTDTEVFSHLILRFIKKGLDIEDSVMAALKMVHGSYALAVLYDKEPEKLIAARNECPLVVGLGQGENFLASDIPAILNYTREMVFLEDGEMAVLEKDSVRFSTLDGKEIEKRSRVIDWSPAMAEKEGYKHFMLKEIFEQPIAVTDTIRGRVFEERGDVILDDLKITANDLSSFDRVLLVACGTSWHAALVGKFLIEDFCKVPTEVDIGSEFRYRTPLVGKNNLIIPISQSGETADTLAAMRLGKEMGATVVSICNVLESSIPRVSDSVIYTHAGPEIGVASTKAFVTQLIALYLFAIYMGRGLQRMSPEEGREKIQNLIKIPHQIEKILTLDSQIEAVAKKYFAYKDFLYLGRGVNYPIALEGALKLKEISYIHAEGYPAGEMKHGPIALIDEEMPVVVILPKDKTYQKMIGNMEEVRARGGKVIAVTTEGDEETSGRMDEIIYIPETEPHLMPILSIIPLQLLAYHIAVLRGTDVDQPRNLAKSVTVE
jgi:glucosamine--fructose-6-phosphate aminotransferase (isomerizing)